MKERTYFLPGLRVSATVVCAQTSSPRQAAKPSIDFQRQIRPILSDSCFQCHGPDKSTRMFDLRLDTKEGAFAARKAGAVIVPGNAKTGLLYERITADQPAPESRFLLGLGLGQARDHSAIAEEPGSAPRSNSGGAAAPLRENRGLPTITIIGGGLAGTEAAWQIARAGGRAVLYEMRPVRTSPAHQTDRLAELVCSNSLKSESENTAPWLLKRELRRMNSLLLGAAAKARVPGGHALTVDRDLFAAEVTSAIEGEPAIEVRREEMTRLPEEGIVIIASGPLTSDALAADIARATGSNRLFFYDSISPIVEADSIDMSIAFRASR